MVNSFVSGLILFDVIPGYSIIKMTITAILVVANYEMEFHFITELTSLELLLQIVSEFSVFTRHWK